MVEKLERFLRLIDFYREREGLEGNDLSETYYQLLDLLSEIGKFLSDLLKHEKG